MWRTWPLRTRLRFSVRSGYRRRSRLTSPTRNQACRARLCPTSRDPLSAFHWAGEMWKATNSGTFSCGSQRRQLLRRREAFSSSGMFGERGRETNGVFVDEDDTDETESAQDPAEPAE